MIAADPTKPPTERLPSYYAKAPKASISPQKRVDDDVHIQRVINGWLVRISPPNVPHEFSTPDVLVFNKLEDLFDALTILYSEEHSANSPTD